MITDAELEDIITDAIADSIDSDRSARDAAKAVLRAFSEEGLAVHAIRALPDHVGRVETGKGEAEG